MLTWNHITTLSKPIDKAKKKYSELKLGVWRLIILDDSAYKLPGIQSPSEIRTVLIPLFRRAFGDMYAISPMMFYLIVVTHLWRAMEETMSLYFSNRLLFFIERRLSEGSDVTNDLIWATTLRIGCSVLTTLFRWAFQGIRDVYRARLKYNMQGLLFAAQLARDLPTSQDNASQLYVEADSVFICLERTIELAKTLISFLLQLRLILHVVGTGLQNAGPTFIALCIFPLIMNFLLKKELWGKRQSLCAAARRTALTPNLRNNRVHSGGNQQILSPKVSSVEAYGR